MFHLQLQITNLQSEIQSSITESWQIEVFDHSYLIYPSLQMAPSFFKVLRHPSAHHLPLPPDFVGMYMEDKIPKGRVMLRASGGHSWRLKIRKISDSYCFTGGWNKVVRDVPLGYADFLIFHLLDPCTFSVTIFKPNGCELVLPKKELDDEDVGGEIIECVVIEDDDVEEEEEEKQKDEVNGGNEMNEDGEVQVDVVVKRKRGRPPGKKVKVTEIVKMKWGLRSRQPQTSGESLVTEVVKRKRRWPQPSEKSLVTEVVEVRKRGRPTKQPEKSPVMEDVKIRKRGRPRKHPQLSGKSKQPRQPSGKSTVMEVVKSGKRGRPAKFQ
ncbi:hypothetical protein L1987_77265 [Smallanthus sonchifolius]|uniref:Uncharacterized protein n=1 Tax=Smallanthus sonchifolius TaxID=185202 RepID=A0ACB8ZAD2_9ASTR|nr:hypothetical protein L1987_77265 [Smallanthus sonchifolius]